MIIERNTIDSKIAPFEEFEPGDYFAPVYSPDRICLRIPLAETQDGHYDSVYAVELKTGKFIEFEDEEMMFYYPNIKITY